MQKLRKFLAAVLVAVMMLSLGSGMVNTEAQAAGETGTITVNNAANGHNYEIYRVFDGEYSADKKHAIYTVNTKWENFFRGDGAKYLVDNANGQPLNLINFDKQKKYINITETNKEEFSIAAHKYADTIDFDDKQTASGESVTFSNLDLGYYLVYSPDATSPTIGNSTVCVLVNVKGSEPISINAKGTTPTITKTADKETTDVGSKVTFTVEGTVPDTSGFTGYIYTVRDTMNGLALTGDYTVTIDGDVVEKKIATSPAADPDSPNVAAGKVVGDKLPEQGQKSFALNIDMTKYQDKIGKKVVITYDAIISEEAIKDESPINKNSATLDYSNNPADWEKPVTTPAQEVEVHSFNVKIHKIDANDKTNLEHAKFVLYKKEAGTETPLYYYYNQDAKTVEWKKLGADGVAATLDEELAKPQPSITEVETDKQGVARFPGIAAGDYFLQETKAPEGYNLLKDPKPVTITKNENGKYESKVISIEVENASGTLLPGTGGIGNTIFYIVGGALILAGVVLLMRKRAK